MLFKSSGFLLLPQSLACLRISRWRCDHFLSIAETSSPWKALRHVLLELVYWERWNLSTMAEYPSLFLSWDTKSLHENKHTHSWSRDKTKFQQPSDESDEPSFNICKQRGSSSSLPWIFLFSSSSFWTCSSSLQPCSTATFMILERQIVVGMELCLLCPRLSSSPKEPISLEISVFNFLKKEMKKIDRRKKKARRFVCGVF